MFPVVVLYNQKEEIKKKKKKEVKKMKHYEMSRPATAEEIANYELIDSLTADYDDGELMEFLDIVSDYVTAYRPEKRKAAYNKLYRIVKKMGATVPACVDWYCMDVY